MNGRPSPTRGASTAAFRSPSPSARHLRSGGQRLDGAPLELPRVHDGPDLDTVRFRVGPVPDEGTASMQRDVHLLWRRGITGV